MGQIKNLTIILVILLSSMAYIGIAFADAELEPISIDIKIAPATLNLDKPAVTVHTDLKYVAVNNTTLKLNDIPADSTFEDDLGNLVARFNSTKVKAIFDNTPTPEATLNLTGEKKDGTSFTGSDTVRVIDPPGKLTETTHSSKI